MVIDVMELKRNGSLRGEFCFKFCADPALLNIPSVKFDGQAEVSGEAEVSGSDVYIDAMLKYALVGECSKCLAPARADVIYPFSAKFSLFPEEDEYLYKSGKVDLTAAVNENIVLSEPFAIYCKPDCKGLCTTCGADLNYCDCGHKI